MDVPRHPVPMAATVRPVMLATPVHVQHLTVELNVKPKPAPVPVPAVRQTVHVKSWMVKRCVCVDWGNYAATPLVKT